MMLFYRINILCSLLILFNSCGSGIDKDSFNLVDHIEDNEGIIQQLKKWHVDSAYIQVIGFPPSTDIEHYIDLHKKGKIGQTAWETDHLFINRDYAEEFFNSVNMEYPILVVWALRKNTVKGNSFNDMGISGEDMVDYENGVNKSEANFQHTIGNYSRTSYYWSPFYLVKVKNEYLMLTQGYPEDREIIGFFEDLIISNRNNLKNYVHSSKNVAFYKKNKSIQSVQPMRLNQIKQNYLVNLNWSAGDSTNLEGYFDNVFVGSTYKIINSKSKVVASGKIKCGTNYIDLKNVSKGILQFQIGSFIKQSILKSTKSFLDTWTSNDGVATLNFYSNSSFEMVIADDKNELKYYKGQINQQSSDDIWVTSGDFKGLRFQFWDPKIITLVINGDEFRNNDRNSQLSDEEVNSISRQLQQLKFYQI